MPIYPADTLEPIRPDMIAITHGVTWSKHQPGQWEREGYNLCFLMDDGRCLATECHSSLSYVLELVQFLMGVRPDEWHECRVEITEADGAIRWTDVAAVVQTRQTADNHSTDDPG
ncbi:MAG TPA: hypothetical protein VM165_02260 [Planctomycetaceae bacterium]|nr:hypothetical protein [Planctomycetaceae bacterium]